MEVKHGENTGSDKKKTILSILEDPKVEGSSERKEPLYLPLKHGYLCMGTQLSTMPSFVIEGRTSLSRNDVRVQVGMILWWELDHTSGKWKLVPF